MDSNGYLDATEWLIAGFDASSFTAYDNEDGQLTLNELLIASGMTPGSLSTVYVDFNATNSGDGTIADPLRSLHQALEMITTSGTGNIQISPGTTSETFTNSLVINPSNTITLTPIGSGESVHIGQ